jgi:hypothetical protein
VLRLRAREHVVGRVARAFRARRRALAPVEAGRPAPLLRASVAHHDAQPGPDRALRARGAAQGGEPRLLLEVRGVGLVAGEVPREAAHERRVGQQRLDGGGGGLGRRHGHREDAVACEVVTPAGASDGATAAIPAPHRGRRG